MSKIADYAQQWLEETGYELGYNENILPKLQDMDIIKKNDIPVWEYMGYRSEKSFYTRREPSALALKEVVQKYGMHRKDYWEPKKKEILLLPKIEGDFNNGPEF